MVKNLHRDITLPVKVVAGDANINFEEIFRYIIEEMKAEAMNPRNPLNAQNTPDTVKRDHVYCHAGLPMNQKGKMTTKGITYLQYSCPLHWSKAFLGQYLLCPAGHPKFLEQKGCNVLIRISPGIQERVKYGTHRFKEVYNMRTSVERVFSRLLSISMQKLSVRGFRAIPNHCTIAHITILLVALTAHRMGEEIRYAF